VTERPVFVSSEAVTSVLSWADAIEALADAYRRPLGEGAVPPRALGGDAGAWLRTLSALPPGGRYFGAKLMGMATDAAHPGVQYLIVLYDRETSRIAGFVDGHQVTAWRTAATSAAALDRLAPDQPMRLAVIGSGLEATMHVRAFAAVRPIERLLVTSPRPERREALAAAVRADLGVPAQAVDRAAEAVDGATVVLAAARSREERPLLFGDWLAPEVTVVSIGSTVPSQREIDASVVQACDLIVCDALPEVVEQTGDMLAAARAGLTFVDRAFSLHQLLSGQLDDRLGSCRRRLFKSAGSGLQDVVIGGLALRKALAAGLATPLPIEFETRR
jgi:ornithine cyclodeaminase/alanine dehydrogenase-like protein (mu-crystallin family)